MKRFRSRQLREAIAHAAEGGQALHLHAVIANLNRAPSCFVNAVRKGEYIAHLFDQDEARLRRTVRRLGVRVVRVERRGTAAQHVDLCGTPLAGAIYECDQGEPWPYGPAPRVPEATPRRDAR